MKTNIRKSSFVQLFVVAVVCMAMGLTGCLSSRSFIEGLAITPHHPIQDSARYHSMNSYQQDFLYLTETVRETHPEPYGTWGKANFDAEQNRFLESLAAETSRVAFERTLQSFLSHIRDSHTSAQTSWMGGQLEYPVSFFWIKDTLILASVGREEDTTLIGSHVLSFYGVPTDEVFTRFTRFISYENIYVARRTLQYYFIFPALHREVGIIKGDTLELTLLAANGTTSTHNVMPVQQPKRIAPYKSHPITQKVNRPFRYTILKEESACYLQWNTMMDLRVVRLLSFPMNILAYPVFWYMGIGYFDNFLENMFEEMKEEGVTTLIVDVRGNGGGSSAYGEQLLYHLDVPSNIKTYSMAIRFSLFYREFFPEAYQFFSSRYAEKHNGAKLPDSLLVTSDFVATDSLEQVYFGNVMNPKSNYYIEPDRNVFKGKVYFLVGDGTYSSAIILSTLVKDNKLFTMVGQPTRGRPSHYGDTPVLKLPNSGIVCRISCKKFFRPDISKDTEDSLYPDVEIWPTFEDLKYGRDPVFDWVLRDAKIQPTSTR
jgi:hypothetical protein